MVRQLAEIIEGVFVHDGENRVAAGSEDAAEFHEPGVDQMEEVGENGDAIDEGKVVVGKSEGRIGGAGHEPERRREIFLAPGDVIGGLIDAPEFSAASFILKMTQDTGGGAAPFERRAGELV